MTSDEYAADRDRFLTALNAVEDACEVFYELAMDQLGDECPTRAEDIGYALVRHGSWIGVELVALLDAQLTLEILVGKAHARATRLSRTNQIAAERQ